MHRCMLLVLAASCLLGLHFSAAKVILRDYNRVTNREFDSFGEFVEEMTEANERGGRVLSTNVIVGVYNDARCAGLVDSPTLRGVQRLVPASVITYCTVKDHRESPFIPKGSDLCANVLHYRKGQAPQHDDPAATTANFGFVNLTQWVRRSVQPVAMQVTNRFPYSVDMMWHEDGKTEVDTGVLQGTLHPGEAIPLRSHLGHIMSVRVTQQLQKVEGHDEMQLLPGPVVHYFAVDGTDVVLAADTLGSSKDTGWVGGCTDAADDVVEVGGAGEASAVDASSGIDSANVGLRRRRESFVGPFTERPISCVDRGGDMSQVVDAGDRFLEFLMRLSHEQRLGLNYVQPQMIRPTTRDGFRKERLPDASLAWLQEWYHGQLEQEQRRLDALEVETVAGPCMNQHASPTFMAHLPPHLKDRLSSDLYPLLHGWFLSDSYYDEEGNPPDSSAWDTYGYNMHADGSSEAREGDGLLRMSDPDEIVQNGFRGHNTGSLEVTSVYGVRRYNAGAVLRMHVDTSGTHVISAIVNVDQQMDGAEDWQLIILDHQQQEHSISMRPGDVLLYESAKLLHGRPERFRGRHYDNVFVHFKPVQGEGMPWNYNWLL